MSAGRKPKPTKIRILEGNREHRPIPINPEPKEASPRAPRWMNKYAKQEYHRIAKVLNEIKVLTEADLKGLENYAQCYARWRMAEEEVEKSIQRGEPNVTLMNTALKYAQQLRLIMVEYGLTPSSRSRISIEPKKKKGKDEWEGLLN